MTRRGNSVLIPVRKTASRKQRKPRVAQPRFPSLLLANVRSLSNKFEEVRLRVRKIHPDVVVLTESWLDEQTPDSSIAIDNYNIYRKDRNSNGGGILCYINAHFSCKVITSSDIPSLHNCCSEILTVFIECISTLLICVYHPFFSNPSKDEEAITVFVEIIDAFLVSSARKPEDIRIVLCGDFNDIRKLSDRLCSLTGLKACADLPSRGSHMLDQIYTNSESSAKASLLPPFGRSDHSALLWKTKSIPAVTTTKLLVRKHLKANKAAFLQAAASIDWMASANFSDSIDECAHHLQSTLLHLLDTHFPHRVIRVRSTEPLWMKPSLKILLNQRDRALSEGKHRKYLRLRDEVIRHEKHLKASHLQQAISSRKPGDFWKSVDCIARRSKKTTVQTQLSAQDFCAHFSSVFQPPSADEEPPSLSDLPHQRLVLSVSEVEAQLLKIKRKSSGPDGIPFWTLRSLAFLLAPVITSIFNKSLAAGRVPSCFKVANICPIPKCSDAKDVTQFRPISLLPILSKTLERLVVRKWVSPHLATVDDVQFAYLPGRGTSCATSVLYHSILRYLDQASGAVRILSVDFAKAFDKLPHKAILSALVHLHLPFEVVSWISDFLKVRFQRVSYKGSFSDWQPVPSGVPQGSVLGPLLFCAVLASLRPACKNSQMVKYADDVTLLHYVRECHEDTLQRELNNIISWSKTTGLPINVSKSVVMDIVTKNVLHLDPLIDESGASFPNVDTLKILGVTFSKDLRWDSHFQQVIRRASKRIFVIRNLRRSGCDVQSMLSVYRATIQSLLVYCYPCVCNAPQRLQNSLLKVEKRVLKIITDGKVDFKDLETSGNELCKRLFQQVLLNPDHPLRFFFDERNPTPRNALTLRRPRCRTARFGNSFIRFCP